MQVFKPQPLRPSFKSKALHDASVTTAKQTVAFDAWNTRSEKTTYLPVSINTTAGGAF